MIAKIYIKNFKSIKSQVISFRNKKGGIKNNIFVFGDNGSGKTSFIQAIAFLKEITQLLQFNEIFKSRPYPNYHHSYVPVSMSDFVKRLYRFGANDEMVVGYDLIINKKTFVYEVCFSPNGIVFCESLYKKVKNKYDKIFTYDQGRFDLGKGVITNSVGNYIDKEFIKFQNQTTFLGFLYYAQEKEMIKNRKDLSDILNFIKYQHINYEFHQFYQRFNYRYDTNITAFQGYVNEEASKLIESSSPIANSFLVNLFPFLDYLKYDVRKIHEDMYYFQLLVYIKTDRSPELVEDLTVLPLSLRRLIGILTGILNAYMKSPYIQDDIDGYVQGNVLLRVVQELSSAEGQVILTFNTTDLMNDIDPKAIYVCTDDNNSTLIYSIEDVEVIRSNHNVRLRYLDGRYGNRKNIKSKEFYKYIRKYEKHVAEKGKALEQSGTKQHKL